jgi:hypothetical protein
LHGRALGDEDLGRHPMRDLSPIGCVSAQREDTQQRSRTETYELVLGDDGLEEGVSLLILYGQQATHIDFLK